MSLWSSKVSVNYIDVAVNISNKWVRLWDSECDTTIYMTKEIAKELASVLADITKDIDGSEETI